MSTQVLPAKTDKEIDDEIRPEPEASKGSPQPKCILPYSFRRVEGAGPAMDLDGRHGKLFVVTLSINVVEERTGLVVSLWGSPDGIEWGAKPLVTLRQRQHCGEYSALLNLAHRPDIRFLRAEWSMNRWGKGERIAQFGFQVFLEESGARVSSSVCA